MIIKKRAKNGSRTRDLNLGKVALYQLSYFHLPFHTAKILNYFSNRLLLFPKISHATVLKCVKKNSYTFTKKSIAIEYIIQSKLLLILRYPEIVYYQEFAG